MVPFHQRLLESSFEEESWFRERDEFHRIFRQPNCGKSRRGDAVSVETKRERGEDEGEDEKERDRCDDEMMEGETRVRDVMEAVERTITSLFYDWCVFFFVSFVIVPSE